MRSLTRFLITSAAIFTLASVTLLAQVKITDGAVLTLNPNSLLELESTNKGLLFPRIAINNLTLPAPLTGPVPAGMMVYSLGGSVTDGFYYWNGTAWVAVASGIISNYLPLTGGTLTGKLNTVLSSTTTAGFNLPHGVAPTAPVNGDLWSTSTGVFARINGVTVGPLGTGTSALTSGNIFVGNVSNIATGVALSGDATILNTGALTLVNSGVTAAQYGNTVGTIPSVTVDAKGRITAASNRTIADNDIPDNITVSSYLPLAGGTMTGKLNTVASSATNAGLTLPHGAAPTTPVNGDIWTTTLGIYSRISGVTIGPLTNAGASAFVQNGNSYAGLATLGTNDNNALAFETNNTEKMRIATTGDVAIGSSTFDATNPEQLKVDAGTTTSYNLIKGTGSVNSYLQFNIKNNSNGTGASSDVVATNDIGDESYGYVDMGINSSTYNQAAYSIGGINDAYLYCIGSATTGGNLAIGTGSSASIKFNTGGSTAANERMRIDATGNLGIGITNPAYKLDVAGNVNIDTPSASSTLTIDANNSQTYPAKIIFKNESGIGDFQIAGDGGDFVWQGGGNRNLQMGAWHGIDLIGGRTTATALAYLTGTSSAYNTRILNVNNSIGLIVQGVSGQTLNLQEWRNSAGTVLSAITFDGGFRLGTAGTVLGGIIKTSVSVTDATTFVNTASRTETLTVAGASVNANVIVNPRTELPSTIGIASSRVSAANTVMIKIINTSTAAVALGTVVFDITIIQ